MLQNGRVSLRVESKWIVISPATEQSQRNQVQSVPGMSSEQVGILSNGRSETKRAFRTVGQASMEYKVKFTHKKNTIWFHVKIT